MKNMGSVFTSCPKIWLQQFWSLHQNYKFHLISISNKLQVTLTPNGAWGGEGSLGCGIGYGYLHRIPIEPRSAEPPSPPPASHMPNPAMLGGNTTTKTSHIVTPMVPAMMSPPMVGTMPPPPLAGFQHQFGPRHSSSPSPPFGGAMAPPPSEVRW